MRLFSTLCHCSHHTLESHMRIMILNLSKSILPKRFTSCIQHLYLLLVKRARGTCIQKFLLHYYYRKLVLAFKTIKQNLAVFFHLRPHIFIYLYNPEYEKGH